jgi:simple sugar transport system substrate-binding protein
MRKVDPKVDEAVQTLNMKDGPTRRKLLTGTGLVSATAAASALLAACSSTSSSGSTSTASSAAGNFPSTPPWKFTFVNHVTTNPFFVPTQYGLQDAAALLGIPKPAWTGSATSSVPEMVSATNAAISAKANGIAVAVIDVHAFTGPVKNAMNAGIPVVSYNADGNVGDPGTNRLAYIGQDLFVSGQALGQRIAASMPGGGDAVGFIATPGTANIQPRIDGAKQALGAAGNIKFTSVASGAALSQENTTINAYVLAHKSTLKGIFAVDAGSTQTVGQIIQKYGLTGKVASGGFDLTPVTLNGIKGGSLGFTIDQQPYLQGFLPVLSLYLFNLSGGLVNPPETNTGLTFVTKANVGPYLNTTSRFEGSSTAQKYIKRSGAIA